MKRLSGIPGKVNSFHTVLQLFGSVSVNYGLFLKLSWLEHLILKKKKGGGAIFLVVHFVCIKVQPEHDVTVQTFITQAEATLKTFFNDLLF